MILVDSKLFKQIAEKFANELTEKYCTETKVKHSFALEALSHAFGYKDYNTIKPKLDLSALPNTSIDELINNGYADVKRFPLPFSSLSQISQRQFIKHLFLQLAFFCKNLANEFPKKFYYTIEAIEFPDFAKIINAVAICTGTKFEYFIECDSVVIYWQVGNSVFDVGVVRPTLNKNVCMQVYNEDSRATQCLIESFSDNRITFNLFHSGDGRLTEEESSFKIGEKLFLTYENDREMRMASMLVNDITNKEFDFSNFQSTYEGMVRARYVVQNHPDVAMYVLDDIYGYNPDFI